VMSASQLRGPSTRMDSASKSWSSVSARRKSADAAWPATSRLCPPQARIGGGRAVLRQESVGIEIPYGRAVRRTDLTALRRSHEPAPGVVHVLGVIERESLRDASAATLALRLMSRAGIRLVCASGETVLVARVASPGRPARGERSLSLSISGRRQAGSSCLPPVRRFVPTGVSRAALGADHFSAEARRERRMPYAA
jgi:hypothetical protein